MDLRRLLFAALVGVFLPLLCRADPASVLIDPTHGFATVYVSLPKKVSAPDQEQVDAVMTDHAGAYVVPWTSFLADLSHHVTGRIQKNEYPEADATDALVLLLREFELQAFGLTWNGGVALTRIDFAFAEWTHESYARDHDFVARPDDALADPLHPWNHTGPLLGRYPRPRLAI